MADDRTLRAIPRIAELIAKADALLITAGAGMGVDSGLPDFRGPKGFWGAYPALANLGISFEQMAQPQWFAEKPDMAWAFYGHRQQVYRETKPHDGFRMLLEWGRAMPAGFFVVTSNVDAHFQIAGFPGHRLVEQHGNIHRYQCTGPCSRLIWHYDLPGRPPELAPDLKIELSMMRAFGKLPLCPECGGLARPNVLMFNDGGWLDDVRRVQEGRYRDWLAGLRDKRVVILECGAGTAIDTIRRMGEDVAQRSMTTLVRINPVSSEADESVIGLSLPALEALGRIDEALPEPFRRRGRDAVPEPPRLCVFDEAADASPGTRLRYVAEGSESIKLSKMFKDAWPIQLANGMKVWVEKLHVQRNYLDFRMGSLLPSRAHATMVIDEAKEFVRKNYFQPEPVVIPPKLYDARSDAPILPALWFAAQIRSHEDVNAEEVGSIIGLIWFAEIDDTKSIRTFVEEALAHVDWKKQASGYWS
jgi:NAD-dependent SIR2 family protein deacetylase